MALLIIIVVLLGAVTSHPASASTPAVVRVEPATSLFTDLVHILVTGLSPRQFATVEVSAVDAKNGPWSSSATYRSSSTGAINVDRSPAVLGSYQGVNPIGLIESMTPTKPAADDLIFDWGSSPVVFRVAVTVAGQQVAATTFDREDLTPGVRVETETLAATGFGYWWVPAPGTPRHPGVLVFGGSEGSISGTRISAALVSAGYPTLDIAYFRAPPGVKDPNASLETGLPSQLRNIPLEYFAKALRWLADQPQVEPQKLYVLSGSRGSEAAFLLGVHYPNLVHGIINLSPSDVVNGSIPLGHPVWTFQGKPLPYSRATIGPFGTPGLSTKAPIPVEDIHGPILLARAGDDQLWDSCGYSQDVEHRLTKAHDPFAHPLYTYPNAGHLVDSLIAYEPISPEALSTPEYIDAHGPTPLANDQADAKLWPHVLHFLATTS